MRAHSAVNLAELVYSQMLAGPDRLALTLEGAGVRPDEIRTYGTLWQSGQNLARALLALGIKPGERFGVLMANHVEFADIMIAAVITGTVFVPIDPRTKADKLAFMLKLPDCVGVIAADYALPNLQPVRSQLPSLRWVVGLETDEGEVPLDAYPDIVAYAGMLQSSSVDLPIGAVDPEGPMQLIFTSGTTGDPKGIVMTHRRFCDTSMVALHLAGHSSDDRLYTGLSLTHANAQVITFGPALTAGLHTVMSRRFTKSRLWDITRKYQCTTFNLLGGMSTAIYAEPPRPDDADNPVRYVISAGMPAAIWEKFERRFGVKVMEFYGAAEGGLTAKPIGEGPIGSIGKPSPKYKYRIVDEDGRDVPRGTPGELLMRAADDTPFKVEYFGNPQASAKKCKGGWLHMGDIVREDEHGWLFFEHRIGGGIRRNGEFVNPGFVEKVIAESGMVEDVFVYGIGAASGAPGEKDVVAAVVPKKNAPFRAKELFLLCRASLEPNVVPTYLQVVDQIPKTASEKPQERFLIEAFEADRSAVITDAG